MIEKELSHVTLKHLKDELDNCLQHIVKTNQYEYTQQEIRDLLLSECKADCGDICMINKKNKIIIRCNEEKIRQWIDEKLIRNTIRLTFEDEEIIKLLMFSIEFAYSIIEGKTMATKTQKGFRERSRDIETIIVNTFTGMLGEVGLKHFLKREFNIEIKLDRTISGDIEKYKTDIVNSKKSISVKTTPNLTAVWAECPLNYDYGVFTKVVVPSGVTLQAFAHVCGMKKLIDFSKQVIDKQDKEILNIIDNLEKRMIVDKCGDIKTDFKIFICGFFKPTEENKIEKNKKLPYIGEIREERYFTPISKLKWRREQWEEFINDAI